MVSFLVFSQTPGATSLGIEPLLGAVRCSVLGNRLSLTDETRPVKPLKVSCKSFTTSEFRQRSAFGPAVALETVRP